MIGQSGEFRNSIRRLLEDLTAYYVVRISAPLTSARRALPRNPRHGAPRQDQGRRRRRLLCRGGRSEGIPLAFETPLLELLPRAPVRDFPFAVEVVQFRGEQPARPLISLLIEVPGSSLQFDEDSGAGSIVRTSRSWP